MHSQTAQGKQKNGLFPEVTFIKRLISSYKALQISCTFAFTHRMTVELSYIRRWSLALAVF